MEPLTSEQRLEREIAMLRQRLDCAEEMRRAISGGEVDAFVVGCTDDEKKVLFLTGAPAHYGDIVDRMQQGVLTVSRAGEILYANERVAAMLGQPLASLFTVLLHAFVEPAVREHLSAFLASQDADATIELALVRADGASVPARLTIASSGDGLASLLVTDLSSRRRLEEAESALQAIHNGEIDGVVVGGEQIMLLGDAHRPYEVMIDRMEQGALTASAHGEVLYANDRFVSLVGVARQSVLGARLADFFAAQEEAPLLRLLERARAAQVEREFTLRLPNDGARPVSIAAMPLEGTDAIACVLTDLSEQKRHREIEEANQRKDEFLAVLAHELRNPLAPIRNAVEILKRSAELGAPARYAAEVIGRQTATLTRLIDDLLDINRLNQGKITLQRLLLDLKDVVTSAVESAQPYIAARQHALEVALPSEPVPIMADPVRLGQVIVNLLSNAAKYTKPGGRVTIAVRVERSDGAGHPVAIVRVADTGIGIPVAHLGRIFEPYAQLTSASGEVASGLGLGLTLSRRLVELHGGTLEATSMGPGQGSEFTIRLPALADQAIGETMPSARAVPKSRPLRVLIADDNLDNLQSLAALLGLLGHETRTARDGAEALTVADEFRPDVAFLDIGMPKLDGYSAARELRTRPWASDVALFALTGWGQPEDRLQAEQAGFDFHLVKPIEPEVLERVLRDSARDTRRRDAEARDAHAD